MATQIELVEPDSKKKIEYTRGGITYRSNLATVKKLKITPQANPSGLSSVGLQVGEKEGKLFITTAAPVE